MHPGSTPHYCGQTAWAADQAVTDFHAPWPSVNSPSLPWTSLPNPRAAGSPRARLHAEPPPPFGDAAPSAQRTTKPNALAFTRKSSPLARPSAQLPHPDGLPPLFFITQRAFCTPPCNGWLISRPCPLGYVPGSSARIGARAPSSGLWSFSCWQRRLTPGGGCGGPSSRSPGWLQRGDGAHCRRSSSCRAHASSYRHPPAGRGRQGHDTDMCCRARRPPAAGPRRARGQRAAGDRGMCAGPLLLVVVGK